MAVRKGAANDLTAAVIEVEGGVKAREGAVINLYNAISITGSNNGPRSIRNALKIDVSIFNFFSIL